MFPEQIPQVLESEVENALQTQKRDKASGPDRIGNNFLIDSKETIIPILTYLFNDVLNTEHIPDQWTTSTIILLHKKGDKNDIGNYRPISLMSNIYKVFAKVLLNRISKTLDENQPMEQAGLRSGFSTLDHIHAVRQVFEKYKEYHKTFYCCFVDYCKAFDSLEHERIWQALSRQGVEKKYIRIIKNIYKNSTAKVKLEREGEESRIKRGVRRQGDPLSPKLFSAVLEDIFRNLDWDIYGLNINGRNLNHLRFAHDLIICARTMNTLKTKIMSNGEEKTISVKDSMTKEIETRVGNAWKRSKRPLKTS